MTEKLGDVTLSAVNEPSSALDTTSSNFPVCRFCLEDVRSEVAGASDDDNRLVSPCACRGTSALVHIGCLRRWQAARAEQGVNFARSSSCLVCCQPFIVDGQVLQRRVPSAGPHSVQPGDLVVSTTNLDGEGRTFHRSVILICNVRPGGIHGVDLTRHLCVPASSEDSVLKQAQTLSSPHLGIQVFRGGPTEGGRLGVLRYFAVATFPASRCGMTILQPAPEIPGLYCLQPWSGLSDQQAMQVLRETSQASSQHRLAGRRQLLLIFCGHAAWGQRQFEAEVRSGSWSLGRAQVSDVLETRPIDLWNELQVSGRLRHPPAHLIRPPSDRNVPARPEPTAGQQPRAPILCSCSCS